MKQQNNKVNEELHKSLKDKKSGKISEEDYLKKYRELSKIHKANNAEYMKIYNDYGREMYKWT